MTPILEITIREYLPGSYEVECAGRTVISPSREELRLELKHLLGLPSDPELLDQIRELEQDVLDRIAD